MAETKKCPKCKEEILSDAKKCKHCGADLRNWFIRHKILTGILVLFVLGIFGSLSGSGSTSKPEYTAPESSEQETTESNQEQPTQETKEAVWTKVKSWQGSGIKKTEAFNIAGKQWRINWSSKPDADFGGILQIYVERPGSDLPVELAANTTEAGSDTSYVYKTGEFVLNINSANTSWAVEVEELK